MSIKTTKIRFQFWHTKNKGMRILRILLLIAFGLPRQVFFLDTRRQKWSLASLNEYFDNAVAEEKPKLGNKTELIEVSFNFKSIVLGALLLFCSGVSFAQKVAEGKEVEITLYNLSTPHNTIYTHFENLQQDNYHPEVAARAFLHKGVTNASAAQYAIKVKHIFDGKVIYLDEHVFPTAVNYLDSTSQTHKYVLAQKVPEIYLVKVGDQWLYSKKTIQNIDRVFKKTYPFGTHKLLTVLPQNRHE